MSHNRSPDYNQCQCLPKAELKTKTNPNGHHSVAVWVRFGFQLGSLEKSDPPNKENCVLSGRESGIAKKPSRRVL